VGCTRVTPRSLDYCHNPHKIESFITRYHQHNQNFGMAGKSYHFYKYILFRHQSLIRANARIRMTCDLTNGELFILNILYTKRNFKPNATYNSEKLKWIFSKKYTQDFDKALKHLKNQGYISSIKKADCSIPKSFDIESKYRCE